MDDLVAMQIKKKLVFLPIETKSREFDSKLLLALSFVNEGLAVIVCSSRVKINKLDFPGIVLLKSAAKFELEHIENLKNSSKKCCVMDEEGLVHTNNEVEHALRFSQTTIDSLDKIFFNGVKEETLLNKFYQIPPEKGAVTGNSRFDLYKKTFSSYYKSEALKLRERYGRFILIPSRFSMVNLANSDASENAYLNFLKDFYVNTEEELNIFKGMLRHGKQIFEAFVKLLPYLSRAFPDIKIIVRPHPSESSQRWMEASDGLKNIEIVGDGPIGPWLVAAESILHNGCTTGFEAFLLGKPVFSYMPYISDEYDLKLPNDVSIKCFSEDELVGSMKVVLDNNSGLQTCSDQEKTKFAEQYLFNSGNQYAYKNITTELTKIATELLAVDIRHLHSSFFIRLKGVLKKILANAVLMTSGLKLPMPKILDKLAYSYRKNPGFSQAEIMHGIEKLSKITGIDLDGLQIEKIDEDAFVIYKKQVAAQ